LALGNIGRTMAERILEAGLRLLVWNRTPGKMQALLDAGAAAAETPADLARRSDIVCICVTDDMAGRLLAASGLRWLDVPVSGGPVGARAGTLAAMVGGDAVDLEFARPVISSYARQVTHMGPVGAGQATKACNQLINFVGMAAVAEALNLAAGFGIDVDRLPQALAGGFADTPILREFARGKVAGETGGIAFLIEALRAFHEGRLDPAWRGSLHILLKDMAIVHDLGRATGRVTPVFDLVESFYRIIDGST
jgi:3-hydroxyisobutyrate dehydrogenase-like beta-hydroxyacid dehydrogenase